MVTESLSQQNDVAVQETISILAKRAVIHGCMANLIMPKNYIGGALPEAYLSGLLSAFRGWTLATEAGEELELLSQSFDFPGESSATYFVRIPAQEPPEEIRFAQIHDDTSATASILADEARELLRCSISGEIDVYPGYQVSYAEYERRFQGVDLDHFRRLLPPRLFEAYVRTMGAIDGWGVQPQDRYKGKE
jgi:hypothetical protein